MGQRLTTVVKNIIIINVLFFLATQILGDGFGAIMAGSYIRSEQFMPWQIVTHMFMHGGLTHIFFNMFALYMFGSTLETYWGPKRFLIYYMITGLGAFFLHYLVIHFQVVQLENTLPADIIAQVYSEGYDLMYSKGKNWTGEMGELNKLVNVGVVGASGAVFGILLAFGMLFPNTQLMLLFPPIPIKAKWFVIIYGGIELYLAFANAEGDNIAHLAHLGGMIFGYFLLKYWQKKRGNFY